MEYIALVIVCIIGGAIQGCTGFGFAMLAIAVMPLFIPFKVASSVLLLLSLTMTAQIAFRLRKSINIKMIIPVTLAAFAGRSIGVYGLMNLKVDTLKIMLGIVLVLLSIYFYKFNNKIRIKSSTRNGILLGLFSGTLGGLFNIGGPPLVIYYFSALEDKMEYSASIQTTFALSNVYTIMLHILYGNITVPVLKLASVGAIAISIGCYIGLKVLEKLNRESLSKAVYTFMAVMGTIMILNK